MSSIFFITLIALCLKYTIAAVSHYETGYNHTNGHACITLSTFSFSYRIQGDFETGTFSATNGEDAYNQIERDIQRKINTLAISKGTYNITRFELGLADEYNAVDAVRCSTSSTCEPILAVNGCTIGGCALDTLYDINTNTAKAEYKILQAITIFFNLGGYEDKFESIEYLGPFVQKSDLDILLYGVKPFHMDSETASIFEAVITEFFVGISISNSSVQIRPAILNSQHVGNGIDSLNKAMTTSRARNEDVSMFMFQLEASLTIYSVHGSRPPRNFEDTYYDYLLSNGNNLVLLLKTKGNSYFTQLDDWGILPSSHDFASKTKIDPVKGEPPEQTNLISSNNGIIYGIVAIFFGFMLPTLCYTLFKNRLSKKMIQNNLTDTMANSHIQPLESTL